MSRKALPKCGGKKRAGGKCTRPAGWGTPHPGTGRCKLHGGSTSSHVKSAEEEQARAAAVRWGQPIETSGAEALFRELHYTNGHVAFYRAIIDALAPNDFVWGVVKRTTDTEPVDPSVEVKDGTVTATVDGSIVEAAGINVWLKLYLEERRHLVDVAERIVRIGLDQRRVQIEEERAQLLAMGIGWFLEQMGLAGDQRALGLLDVMLRSLQAGRPPAIEAGDGT